MFLPSGQEDYSFAELLPMAVIGVIGGLLGSVMSIVHRVILYVDFQRFLQIIVICLNLQIIIYFFSFFLYMQEPCLTSLHFF